MRQQSEGSINLIAAISSANTLILNKDKQLLSAPDAMQRQALWIVPCHRGGELGRLRALVPSPPELNMSLLLLEDGGGVVSVARIVSIVL